MEGEFLPELTPTCLGCICEATSNCNLTIGCLGRLCGPFLISKEYWEDAGRPVLYLDHPARKGAHETCLNDPYCAAATMMQYVTRYAQVSANFFVCYTVQYNISLKYFHLYILRNTKLNYLVF